MCVECTSKLVQINKEKNISNLTAQKFKKTSETQFTINR